MPCRRGSQWGRTLWAQAKDARNSRTPRGARRRQPGASVLVPCVRCNEWRTRSSASSIRRPRTTWLRSAAPLEDAGRANVPPARVIAGPRALLTFRPFHLVATALPAGDRAVAPFDGGSHHATAVSWADGDTPWADADSIVTVPIVAVVAVPPDLNIDASFPGSTGTFDAIPHQPLPVSATLAGSEISNLPILLPFLPQPHTGLRGNLQQVRPALLPLQSLAGFLMRHALLAKDEIHQHGSGGLLGLCWLRCRLRLLGLGLRGRSLSRRCVSTSRVQLLAADEICRFSRWPTTRESRHPSWRAATCAEEPISGNGRLSGTSMLLNRRPSTASSRWSLAG